MAPSSPRRRRARPVADAPIDLLVPRAADLAKGWLLALVEDAPLEAAPALLGTTFVDESPQLCEAVLRALAEDRALRRLQQGGSLFALAARVGELAGTGRDAAATMRAIDALAGVLWASLRQELTADDAELVSDLAERLTLVCGLLRVAALEGATVRVSSGTDPGEPGVAAGVGRAAGSVPDGPPAEPMVAPATNPSSTEPLWMDALENEIAHSDIAPLSLLLAELDDAERVAATESAVAATAAFEHFAQAVRRAVRRQDILVSETDGRAWIIARETGRADAQALAGRVAEAVGNGAAWRGAPLIASVGVAVLGEDGRTADELIDAAEEARFAAAASGTDVAR
jgi:GGDEF domain-containing protein